jgi:hypothetical protein
VILSSSEALDIRCSTQTNYWTAHGHLKECIVFNLEVLSDDVYVDSVKSVFGDYLNNDDVMSFYVKDSSQFRYMPKGVENHLKNLKVLVVAYTSLMVLRQEDLKNFSELQDLYVDNNLLEVIENDLFESNPKIKHINFSSNRIKVVGVNAFGPVKSLIYLSIQDNFCINGKAENENELQALLAEIRINCSPPEYMREKAEEESNLLDNMSKQEPSSAVSFNIVKIQVVVFMVSLVTFG